MIFRITYKLIVCLIFLTIILSSCDKVEEPFFEEGATLWNGRKVLIYDFTGHKCGNCPRAHKLLETLKSRYAGNVVSIAIHSTFFAVPDSNSDGEFSYDFRTDIGDELGGRGISTDCYYGELTLPIGLVNNLSRNNLSPDSRWAEEVEKYIGTYPEFDIRIYNSYCELDKNITTDIHVETLIRNYRNIYINAFVIEDGIVQWQADYSQTPSNVENYIHNNVLRDGFIGTFGEALSNSNEYYVGKTINQTYSLEINNEWDKSNCSVVVFVYDFDTKEVMQVELEAFPE